MSAIAGHTPPENSWLDETGQGSLQLFAIYTKALKIETVQYILSENKDFI